MFENATYSKMIESETLFQAIVEQLGEGISIADRQGKYLFVNKAFCKMTGYSAAELAEMNMFDLLPADATLSLFPQEGAEQPEFCTIELLRKNRSRFWAEIKRHSFELNGQYFVLGILRDLTREKLVEEQILRQSENKYRSLFENMLNGYAYCKMVFEKEKPVDFIYIDVNKAFERLTGLVDVAGKKVSEVIPGIAESDPELMNIYGRVALGGNPETFEKYVKALSGWFSVSVYCPEIGYFVATFDAITERKLADIEREKNIQILEIINAQTELHEMMRCVLNFMCEFSGCRAVGIRLRDGEDFPYYVTSGFSDDFVAAEMHLCIKDRNGKLLRDDVGNPVLECMCGNILCGRFDPAEPFFTPFGSFISRNTTERQPRTCNRCNLEGYESVLLVPLRVGGEIFGLLQFNDYRPGYFSQQFISQVERLSGNIANAVAQLKAREDLRVSEQKYRVLFNTFPLGITISDKSGRIVETNDIAAKLLGVSKDEHQTRKLDDSQWRIVDQTGIPLKSDDFASVRALKENRLVENDEIGVVKPNGEVTWLSVTAAPLLLENYGVVVTYGDISARKRAEKDYQTLFREMLDGFALHQIICDDSGQPADYRFLAVNPAFENMTGLKADEIVGRTVLEVLPDIERNWIETYGRVALSGEPAFFENYSAVMAKHFQVTAFRPAPGQFACIFADITERKIKEEENSRLYGLLRQAQKLESIGNLAGGIAHDFNNILFPIVGISEMLMEDLVSGSAAYESIQEIYNAGIRGSELVKQILAFSRQTEHVMVPVNFQDILAEVIKLARSTIPANIRIEEDIQSNCGQVIADPTQLHQIAMNLITNAYHAVAPKSGEILITLKETILESGCCPESTLVPGPYAILAVEDTGSGIAPNIVDKIFEPYFTTKEKGKGTGLGLAVVYGIVQEHGGDIRVRSKLDKGTAFEVYLPLATRPIAPPSGETIQIKTKGSEKILVVDDEVPIVRLERIVLERLGYQVTTRSNSLEALEAFKADPYAYDLMITDMTMPHLTGDQLAKEILRIRPSLPVIICTGFSEEINREKADQIGIKGFLMKPVVNSEIAQMVRSVLDEAKGGPQ